MEGAAFEFWTTPAQSTRRVDATIALWPELELTVTARDIDENPIAGARVMSAFLCGQFDDRMTQEVVVVADATDAQGRTRLRGVPYLPGFPLTVFVDGGDDESHGFEQIAISERAMSMVVDCCSDPDEMPNVSNSAMGIGGGPSREPAEWGAAEIEAHYFDGSVAAGARYRLDKDYSRGLDARGRAALDYLTPGSHGIWLCEPGRVPTRASFEVKAGETTRVTLQEDAGWTLRVRTVDGQGSPLRFRPLRVSLNESSTPYHLVVGGVESIPIQTGADGTVLLPNLGKESMTIAVVIAGRTLVKEKLPYDPTRREIVLRVP